MNEVVQKKNKSSIFTIVIAVLVIALVVSYFAFFKDLLNRTYNAVFLDNNEVYFGKISSKNGEYIKLKDVYYLRVTYTVKQDEQGQQYQEPNYQIVKMGTEMHGPKDNMDIVRSHVLFTQPLDSSSQVLSVIDSYKKAGQLPSVPQANVDTTGQQPVTNTETTTQIPGTYGVQQPATVTPQQ